MGLLLLREVSLFTTSIALPILKIMASPLENLESSLEMFVENVRQIRIISMVQGLQEIDRLKSQVQDISVPLEVFDYIDQGRNPQLYTKDCMEKALCKNEEVKGKIDSYRKFKAHLLAELHTTFPNELAKYRAIRGDNTNPQSSVAAYCRENAVP
ncbi:Hypothetical predicted protein [Cloeon dipterum]|uniref:Mediator of RNA polymerase II transcription subunit 10 n=1 Tax=Cloeon dipterum TaxID=197152 RepID=A0A8S1BYI2_9INSE|nr:Hypothetical predicted protein [Cloeon dipterum]